MYTNSRPVSAGRREVVRVNLAGRTSTKKEGECRNQPVVRLKVKYEDPAKEIRVDLAIISQYPNKHPLRSL
ncbi:hypothetical protein I315_02478 [Cryptococcus gattii Ru294]|uniref:Uncharacterized protein n=2 Tax=Cryptococcus gattii TaxID=37769 RepID=E6RD44_CRYGW|nr:Hypothetical Protein CGB_K0300C [Cryptococcus gattii WM276]KIR55240.1 hypothetical protein I315_02478 [Cryptococcus gattii Ru294]KIR79363.1 hypothetical protein I306_03637 [Cryptococcus gattii EJB2]KIY35150.1 hypothetical protein I305_02056 [Cryptococcus gattii E566]KJE05614.1 hypothetical protein I311_00339 [Cryptococcus gattii NT-10]ADV24789.1 Hypothetical Protein CGB_K0300C [Cryptococcus gattii WM276]